MRQGEESCAPVGQVPRVTLRVWDAQETPPASDDITVLWCGFRDGRDARVLSMPQHVEEQSDALRARYLAWLHDLGEAQIQGRRLVDHLELRPGLSFWWMTAVAQKYNAWGESPVHNAIKLFALEQIIDTAQASAVELVSTDEPLAACLEAFCARTGISFRRRSYEPAARTASEPRLRRMPLPLRALLLAVRYVSQRLTIRRSRSRTAATGDISFFDILVHVDGKALSTGPFASNYWTRLVNLLRESKVPTRWFHVFFRHEAISSIAQATALIERFNGEGRGIQHHALIDEAMSPSRAWRALCDYVQLVRTHARLTDIGSHFQPRDSRMNFWPLFRREWDESLRGPSAMHSCLALGLFEGALSGVPRQRIGVYILENQPWEFALIHAWKSAGHGELVGVAHTTVRYWDLRYFYDSRSYRRQPNSLPMPARVAVNGPVARQMYVRGGYPENELVDVEALRYLHLLPRPAAEGPIDRAARPPVVLICGDFHLATSHKLLSWMERAAPSLPPDTQYLFKAHPAYAVDTSAYRSLDLQQTNAPLGEVLPNVDVVFASCITSAAVDSLYLAVPVIQLLDGRSFNMSPLRGLRGSAYVASPSELATALKSALDSERYRADTPYFFLDEQLPRWRKLLQLHE
ncbi:TIGR04326 family surface carbohydrate biosynthesis protein [Steroidobacter flavus]|uniref:TIGR04326 family surface carbohydrate biosynthesis protein n=1 Tax=Steroidobacter flavus TaxID=1842136 RepID=A0ABV8T0E3_9GAMM